MSLTKENVKKIARLSRIKIEEGEHEQIADQLNSIMSWIDQLNAVNTDGIDLDCTNEQLMEEREDIVTDGNIVDAILSNATASQHNMFAVPKVVE